MYDLSSLKAAIAARKEAAKAVSKFAVGSSAAYRRRAQALVSTTNNVIKALNEIVWLNNQPIWESVRFVQGEPVLLEFYAEDEDIKVAGEVVDIELGEDDTITIRSWTLFGRYDVLLRIKDDNEIVITPQVWSLKPENVELEFLLRRGNKGLLTTHKVMVVVEPNRLAQMLAGFIENGGGEHELYAFTTQSFQIGKNEDDLITLSLAALKLSPANELLVFVGRISSDKPDLLKGSDAAFEIGQRHQGWIDLDESGFVVGSCALSTVANTAKVALRFSKRGILEDYPIISLEVTIVQPVVDTSAADT